MASSQVSYPSSSSPVPSLIRIHSARDRLPWVLGPPFSLNARLAYHRVRASKHKKSMADAPTSISETREGGSTVVEYFTAPIATASCSISFWLALIAGVGSIAPRRPQFAHFFDNCYCNVTVLGRGTDSYIIVFYDGSATTMRNPRPIVVLSGVVTAIYVVFLRLMPSLPKDLDDR
jgi:hypothetical protein